MSNDIATRLKNDRCCFPECHWLQTEAADEIERLRKAITDFIIKTSDSRCTWQMENDAIEELKKAVRGE